MGICLCMCHWSVLHRHFGPYLAISCLVNKSFDFCPPDQRSVSDLDPAQGPVLEEPEDEASGHAQQVSGLFGAQDGSERRGGVVRGDRALSH